MESLIIPIIGTFALFNIFFIISLATKDMSVIDLAWGLAFLLMAYAVNTNFQSWSLPYIIIFLYTLVWSLRLTYYIYQRNKRTGEDFRYKKMKEQWKGNFYLHSYFKVFTFQAIFSILCASPILLFKQNEIKYNLLLLIIGTTLAFIGLLTESIADYQKDKFKRKEGNQNKPCKEGLWYYSQHPNYFGEALFWWSIALIALSVEMNFFIFIGPAILNWSLIKFSGIPFLEEKYKEYPEYLDYMKSTSRFIPWPPKI
ncbi:MAG: DUF1295 domain-containing protein [Oligoflexia bacterium]|nr:DUF1295 domain-containing protein [Oligoflexia bacterium]